MRIVGYDAPESYRPRCAAEAQLGAAAKRRLGELLRGAGSLDYARVGYDRYGRSLVRLFADDREVAEIMIAEGLGRPYAGGRRKSWC